MTIRAKTVLLKQAEKPPVSDALPFPAAMPRKAVPVDFPLHFDPSTKGWVATAYPPNKGTARIPSPVIPEGSPLYFTITSPVFFLIKTIPGFPAYNFGTDPEKPEPQDW